MGKESADNKPKVRFLNWAFPTSFHVGTYAYIVYKYSYTRTYVHVQIYNTQSGRLKLLNVKEEPDYKQIFP